MVIMGEDYIRRFWRTRQGPRKFWLNFDNIPRRGLAVLMPSFCRHCMQHCLSRSEVPDL